MLITSLMLPACGKEELRRSQHIPVAINDCAITVHRAPRSYMQSDRRGAFLLGAVGGGLDSDRFSVGGVELLRNVTVEAGGGKLTSGTLDSARILPDETHRYYRGGATVALEGLEGLPGIDTHGFAVLVTVPRPGRIVLGLSVAPGAIPSIRDHRRLWHFRGGLTVVLTGEKDCTDTPDGIASEGRASARFVVLAVPGETAPGLPEGILDRVDSLIGARRIRMENLLNASYIHTSDDTLTKALNWMKLCLDAMVVDRRDTFAVAGIPWDGTLDLRDNVQSIAGLGLATGDYGRTAAIIRSLSRYQDTGERSVTYGRLPDRIVNGHPRYGGADIAPWFARELYEQIVCTDDTALLRGLYPVIRRSIDGTLRGHADKYNLLVHGPYETWMNTVARGNRAAEVQASWYFEQLIGRFVAEFLGDSSSVRRWGDLPERTAQNFRALFADSAARTVADHLEPDGKRVMDIRPNTVMCLELLDEEPMRFAVTRTVARNLIGADGIFTLAPSDPRFSRSPAGSARARFNGPVWTWLEGPLTYALTRYDRQDVSYRITAAMAHLAVSEGMAGALPAMLDPAPAGLQASLTGMAEFVRSVYQDYLGVRIDMEGGTIALQPKLPVELSNVEFTVRAGTSPIDVEYRKGKDNTRVLLDAPSLPQEMKVNFLWMMDNGDAWRGMFRLRGGTPVLVVLGDDDALLFQGDQQGEFEGKRKLKSFSQRREAADLTPVF